MKNVIELLTNPRIQNVCRSTPLQKRMSVMENQGYPVEVIKLMNEVIKLHLYKNDDYRKLLKECKKEEMDRLIKLLCTYLTVLRDVVLGEFIFEGKNIEILELSRLLFHPFIEGERGYTFFCGPYTMQLILKYAWKKWGDHQEDEWETPHPLQATTTFTCSHGDTEVYSTTSVVMILDEKYDIYNSTFRTMKALFIETLKFFEFQVITKHCDLNFLCTLIREKSIAENKDLPLWFEDHRKMIEIVEKTGNIRKMKQILKKISTHHPPLLLSPLSLFFEKVKKFLSIKSGSAHSNLLPGSMAIISWYCENLLQQTHQYHQLRDTTINLFTKIHFIVPDRYKVAKIKEEQEMKYTHSPHIFLIACNSSNSSATLKKCVQVLREEGWGGSTIIVSDTYRKTYSLLITNQFDFFIRLPLEQEYEENLNKLLKSEFKKVKEKVYNFQCVNTFSSTLH